jgi:hypothetical protein
MFHHDHPFISLHYAHVTLTPSPHFTPCSWWFPPHIHFTWYITFLVYRTESLKPLQIAGSRAVWSYLERNIFWYLSSDFCSNFPTMINPTQHGLYNISPIALQARSPTYFLKKAYMCAMHLCLPRFPLYLSILVRIPACRPKIMNWMH